MLPRWFWRTSCVYCGERIDSPPADGQIRHHRRDRLACRRHVGLVPLDSAYTSPPADDAGAVLLTAAAQPGRVAP